MAKRVFISFKAEDKKRLMGCVYSQKTQTMTLIFMMSQCDLRSTVLMRHI